MSIRDRNYALLQAAQLYHIDGLTQAAVADRLGVTRWTVSRLLQEASEQGIVRMTINHARARVPDLEAALKNKYGLEDARVVRTQADGAATYVAVAQTAADYVSHLRPVPKVVALGWGKVTAGLARALPQGWSPGVTVAQGCAAPPQIDELFARGPARILASRGPGKAYMLEATPIADTAEDAVALMRDKNNRKALELAASADITLLSPTPITNTSIVAMAGVITKRQIRDLQAQGVVAGLFCRLIDGDGNPALDMEHRVVGMPLDKLKNSAMPIAVGHGMEAATTMKGVLAGRYAKVIIVDQQPAEALLNVE